MAANLPAAVGVACAILPCSRAIANQLLDSPSTLTRSITDADISGNASTKLRSIYNDDKPIRHLFFDPRPTFSRPSSVSISINTHAPRPSNPSRDTTREALSIHIKEVDHGVDPSLHDEAKDRCCAQTLDIHNEGMEDTECRQERVLLQCWIYETENSQLTFAEKLEKSKWETVRLEKL